MIHVDERRLAAWLEEGPEHAPAEGLARTLAATREVGQRPGWLATITSPYPRAVDEADGAAIPWVRGVPTRFVFLGLLALFALLAAVFVGKELLQPRNLLAYCADARVYTVPAEGGTPTPVLDVPACGLQWSPDGRWLLASAWETADIWVVRADGGGARVIGSGTDPRWSPDGRSIAFTSVIEGVERPVIHDVESGREQPLDIPGALPSVALMGWVDATHVLVRDCTTCETTGVADARWWILPGDHRVPLDEPIVGFATLSPDGTRAAWSRCSFASMDNCGGLLVTDVASGITTEVAPPPQIAYDPMTWNFEADTLVYPEGDTSESAVTRLAATRLDGTRIPITLPWDGGIGGGAYSPDGEQLAVVHMDGLTRGSLFVLDPGGDVREIASANGIDIPTWQPPVRPRFGIDEPASASPNPCVGSRPTETTVLFEVVGGDGCVRVYGGGYTQPAVDFDAGDAGPDLRWRGPDMPNGLVPEPGSRLVPSADGSCPEAGASGPGGWPTLDPPSGDVVPGRSWCLVTSGGAVVRLTVRDDWSRERPLELDFVVEATGRWAP